MTDDPRIPLFAVSDLAPAGADARSGHGKSDTLGDMLPMVFSASRIGTWAACNSKAAWEYFAGYRSGDTRATLLGGDVHAWLETHVPAGAEADHTTEVSAIASEILPFIPEGVLQLDPQFEAHFTLQGRHRWMGYKDLRVPGAAVIDYKTTSDFKYLKTEEELRGDPQTLLYAHHEFIDFPAIDTLPMRWIYSRTRKPYQARPVDLLVTREEAAAGFAALETFADEMQAAADAAPPQSDPIALHKYILASVKQDRSRCGDYGGCPHQARCGVMFRDPNAPKERTHVNLKERILAMSSFNKDAANSPAAPPPAPVQTITALLPPPMPTPVAVVAPPASPNALMTRLAAELGAPAPAPPADRPDFAALAAACPVVPTQGNPHPLGNDMPPHITMSQEKIDATVAAAAAINPPKRPRGRPKSDTVPVPALASEPPALSPPAPKTEPADIAQLKATIDTISVSRGAPALSPGKSIGTLYIGCAPVGPYTSVDSLLASARDMIGPDAYYTGYGFKTDGNMLNCVNKIIASKPIDRLVVQDPRLKEAAVVLLHLRSAAVEVVEALR